MIKHTAILGAQRGDEGKGKIVDLLADEHDVVVRFGGGTNAGHTVVHGGKKFPLHLIPSGILRPDKLCVIGDGVVLDPVILAGELKRLDKRVKRRAKLILSRKAHLIMPWHKIRDGVSGKKLGTTMRGIGPTYTDATARRGIRVMDWSKKRRFRNRVREEVEYNAEIIGALARLYGLSQADLNALGVEKALNVNMIVEEYVSAWNMLKGSGVRIVEVGEVLQKADDDGLRILYEGAQAVQLDITHGHYPYVTSSHPSVGGLFYGAGFRPRELNVIGVSKAYFTHVGTGPFPTELTGKKGDYVRERGNEYGTTTGRPRRCGWLDMVVLKYAKRINGLDEMAMTKLDILSGMKKLQVATSYDVKGKEVGEFSADHEELDISKPNYETVLGWEEEISKARVFSDLPKQAQKYIEMTEEKVGVPIKFVGVGPGREEIVLR